MLFISWVHEADTVLTDTTGFKLHSVFTNFALLTRLWDHVLLK